MKAKGIKMKKCTLMLPDKLADYLQNRKVPTKIQVRSLLLMLYPFLEDGVLSQTEVASMLNLSEDQIRFVYDQYDLLEDEDGSWNHWEEEKAILSRIDQARKVSKNA